MNQQESNQVTESDAMFDVWASVRTELCSPGQFFELEEIEVRGQLVKSWRNAPASLRDLWLQAAGHGDAEYLVYGEERWTYAEAHRDITSIVAWLQSNGIRQNDRVAIAMRNYPEWLLAYWATLAMGATVVGVNAWWVAEELSYGLNDAQPGVIICDEQRLERLEQIRGEIPDMHVVAVRCDRTLPDYAVDWSDLLGSDADLPEVDIDPEDDACIFYTSGTTGHPKGAQLTHRGCANNLMSSVFSNLAQITALTRMAGKEPSPPERTSVLITTPLFHVTANNVVAHTSTLLGNKLVLMYKWDAGDALRLIEREKVSAMSGVPVMAREVISHPDFARTDTSSLSSLGGGGAPLQPDLVKKIDGKSSAPVTGYGMTEVCGLASGIIGPFFLHRPDSVGPVLPVFDVRCVDAEGETLPAGERGEVLLRSAQVIKGYLNRPQDTAKTIVDGWLHTGDVGYLDERGLLYIVDRIKDMVLRGGENIYCAEVEAVLFQHDAVSEAAVFAVPDEMLGEEVGAAIYLESGATFDADAFRQYCSQHLAAYKIPRY
ncbi:MAG: class I adenylate-forming enzyme family protein, partial [Halioglobus sp.]|nr:class I adenylate-forming enzyme family protein [Halioglobus sp.]